MPEKLTTTACFIQEESSGGKQFRYIKYIIFDISNLSHTKNIQTKRNFRNTFGT